MSKREELLELITKAGGWYTQAEVCAAIGTGAGTVSPLLNALADEKEIQRMKPPAGFGKGVHVIYGPLGMTPPEGAAEYVSKVLLARKAKKLPKKLPKKVKGSRAEARSRRAAKHGKRKAAFARQVVAITSRGEQLLAVPLVPRWALTSDGAFINLADNLEIGKSEARALVAFVRTLDAGAMHEADPTPIPSFPLKGKE